MQRIGNQIGVWMYRVSDGRLASHSKNITVLMITAPGRRTGVLHSTCVRYLDTADGFLVWGTASGAPRDPDWFRNLRKAKTADVQIGAKTLQVRPRELLGAERDAAWNGVVLAQAPEVEKYAHEPADDSGGTSPAGDGPLRGSSPADGFRSGTRSQSVAGDRDSADLNRSCSGLHRAQAATQAGHPHARPWVRLWTSRHVQSPAATHQA